MSDLATAGAGSTPPLKLLSLDGGGIRGLSSLYILRALMHSLDPKHPPKPCEYFNLIGGTSTGGLIAIMLGRLEMSVDECIEKYVHIAEQAFKHKHWPGDPRQVTDFVNGRGTYQAAYLEKEFKDVCKVREGDENATLLNQKARCKVFVCSYMKALNTPTRLRSYKQDDDLMQEGTDMSIWEAARATSAAPTYFDPMKHNDQCFTDGGTGMNNPVEIVLEEAKSIWPGALSKTQSIISIGTGMRQRKDFGDGIFHIVHTLKRIATETEETHRRFAQAHVDYGLGGRYFRFNVEQGLQTVGLGDYHKTATIHNATMLYLEEWEVRQRIQKLVAVSEPESGFVSTQDRDKLLGWLDFVDQTRYYEMARALRNSHIKTGDRFLKTHYQQWVQKPRAFFWLQGKPGSGKTVLTTTIIDEIEKSESGLVAYYYVSFRREDSQDLRSLRCALLIQLIKGLAQRRSGQGPDQYYVPPAFQNLYNKCFPSTYPSDEDLDATLKAVISRARKCFIVVDAVDECSSPQHRAEFVKYLAGFSNAVDAKVHVLITSRPDQDISTIYDTLKQPKDSVYLEPRDVNHDIRKHILAVMKEIPYSGLSSDLQAEILNHLCRRADGDFRWAGLQINELWGKSRLEDIQTVLTSLPHSLAETYDRMLTQIDNQGYGAEALSIFRWLAAAGRPLTLIEVNEIAAFSIRSRVPGSLPSSDDYQVTFRPGNRFHNPHDIHRILSCLVAINEDFTGRVKDPSEDHTNRIRDRCTYVAFSHSTVQEYLKSEHVQPPYFRLDTLECAWHVLKSSLAYMDAYDASRAEAVHTGSFPLICYVCLDFSQQVSRILKSEDDATHKSVRDILIPRLKRHSYSMGVAAERAGARSGRFSLEFSNFARRCLTHPVACTLELKHAIEQENTDIVEFLVDSATCAPKDAFLDIVPLKYRSNSRQLLYREARFKYLVANKNRYAQKPAIGPVLDMISQSGTPRVQLQNVVPFLEREDEKPRKSRGERRSLWEQLLRCDEIDINAEDDRQRTVVLLAALLGDQDLFEFLLEQRNVNLRHKDASGWCVLKCAIVGGNSEIVKRIIDMDKFSLTATDRYGWTAFDWSSHLDLDRSIPQLYETQISLASRRHISFEVTKEMKPHRIICALALSNDGSQVVMVSTSEWAKLDTDFWVAGTGIGRITNLQTSRCGCELKWQGSAVCVASWSPDNSMIITGHQSGTARLWKTETGELLQKISICTGKVTGCQWSLDGQSCTLSTTSAEDSLVRLHIQSFETHILLKDYEITDIAMSADRSRVVGIDATSYTLICYRVLDDVLEWAKPLENETTTHRDDPPISVCMGQCSNEILLRYACGSSQTRDLAGGDIIQTISGPDPCKGDSRLLQAFGGIDDSFIIRGEESGYISIWDRISGEMVGFERGHCPFEIRAIKWSKDDPYGFISTGDQGRMKIWSCRDRLADDHPYRKKVDDYFKQPKPGLTFREFENQEQTSRTRRNCSWWDRSQGADPIDINIPKPFTEEQQV